MRRRPKFRSLRITIAVSIIAHAAVAVFGPPFAPRPVPDVHAMRAPAPAAVEFREIVDVAPRPRPIVAPPEPGPAIFDDFVDLPTEDPPPPPLAPDLHGAASGGAPAAWSVVPGAMPEILSRETADYPDMARRAGVEGVVRLDVVISPRGRVAEVSVAASSGSALLDDAAREAVRRWRFAPARQGSRSVASKIRVHVRFEL